MKKRDAVWGLHLGSLGRMRKNENLIGCEKKLCEGEFFLKSWNFFPVTWGDPQKSSRNSIIITVKKTKTNSYLKWMKKKAREKQEIIIIWAYIIFLSHSLHSLFCFAIQFCVRLCSVFACLASSSHLRKNVGDVEISTFNDSNIVCLPNRKWTNNYREFFGRSFCDWSKQWLSNHWSFESWSFLLSRW